MQGLARVGSGFAFSTVVQGHQVTAVGEVPAQTVESIAHSVKSFGNGPRPSASSVALRRHHALSAVLAARLRPVRGDARGTRRAAGGTRAIPSRCVDVDAEPATRVRYGHKIPVLLFGGELVCHGRLDHGESCLRP